MKKLFTWLFVSALLLTGCTSKPADPGKDTTTKTLRIAGLDGGYGVEHWKTLAKNFEASHEGVVVELEFEKNIADILRPKFTAGEGIPDLVYLSVGAEGGFTDALIKENGILDITDALSMTVPTESGKVKDKIVGGFTDTLVTNPYGDQKTYLAPLFYGPCGLFYNANLIGEGKKYALPKTWDELLALGDQAAKDGIALFTYPTTGYFDAFFYALLNEVGGPEFYNKAMNYDVETWKSEQAKQAFELVAKLAKYTHKDTVSNANKEGFRKNQQLILDNKALFIPNGTWLPGEMADAPRAEGFAWGFTALPALTSTSDAYSFTFFEQMYIPNGAKEVSLAKEFIAYLYSDEAANVIYTQGKGAMQPIVGASALIPDGDANKLFYSIYDDGAKAAMGGFAAAPAVEGVDLTSAEGILFGSVNSVVNGKKTAEQWQAEVVAAVEKIAANLK